MGAKNGNSLVVDATAMATAVIQLQLNTRQIQAYRDELQANYTRITTSEDMLTGRRAEAYRDCLKNIQQFLDKVTDVTEKMLQQAKEKNAQFFLAVDLDAVDQQAQAARESTKKVRVSKLKGV